MEQGRLLISVIMAAYNAERFIGEAIESVLLQTIKDLEIVICDDHSADRTAQIIYQYADQGRITLIKNEQNMGPAYSRNRCLGAAQGIWIALLDADDIFSDAGRFEKMLDVAQRHHADMVFDNMYILSECGERLGTALKTAGDIFSVSAEDYIRRDCNRAFQFGFLQPMIRRDIVGDIRQRSELGRGEDFVFVMECLMAGAKAVYTPQPMYGYRQTAHSMSRSPSQQHWLTLLSGNDILLREAMAKGMRDVSSLLKRRGERIAKAIDYMHIARLAKEMKLMAAARETLRTIDGIGIYFDMFFYRVWRCIYRTRRRSRTSAT